MVATGGFVGALLRFSTFHLFPVDSRIITICINIIGSFLLALLYTICTAQLRWSNELKWLLGTGVLGGFTTFSTFSIDIVSMLESSMIIHASLYILLSVGGGIAAAFAGAWLGRLLRGKGANE